MYRIKKNTELMLKVDTIKQAIDAICTYKGQPLSDIKISDAKKFFENSPKATYNFDEMYTVERAQL